MYKNSVDIFAEIKSRLSMSEVVRRYVGLEPNRAGFIPCSFHQEKTASCKIYKNSFYCFGCGEGGSIIDFLAKLKVITPFEVATLLNVDFGLNLPIGKKLTSDEVHKVKADNKKREDLRGYVDSFNEWFKSAFHIIRTIHHLEPPRIVTLEDGAEIAVLLGLKSMTDFLFDEYQECRTFEEKVNFYKCYHKTIAKMELILNKKSAMDKILIDDIIADIKKENKDFFNL